MAKKVVKETIHAKGFDISIYTMDFENEFISLTDIAKYKSNVPNDVIKNWMRSRETLEFLGLWETLHNPDFKPVEFDGFRKEAGLHAFTMSPSKWIESVNAIGITTKAGRYGGTYAHSDIALEFASWISAEFNDHGYVKKIRQNGTIPGFSDNFVKKVIDNPVYMGKIAYGRRRTEKKNQCRRDGLTAKIAPAEHINRSGWRVEQAI